MRSPKKNRPAAKVTGMALLIVGAGLVALSLLADRLDIGGGEGFGYQQLIVLIVGIVLMLGGLRIIVQPWFNKMNGPQDFAELEAVISVTPIFMETGGVRSLPPGRHRPSATRESLSLIAVVRFVPIQRRRGLVAFSVKSRNRSLAGRSQEICGTLVRLV